MEDLAMKYWAETLPVLKQSFSEVVFDTCIRKLDPLYIDDNVFVLKTNLDFFKITIEQRHLPKITSILRAVTEQDFSVKILSPEDFTKVDPDRQRLQEAIRASNLRSKYVFETFVRGKSNELAYAAAAAVADDPGTTTYNPLFLYGGVGLGKTHLMHSIGNYIIEQNQDTKLLYVTSEIFTNELITSIRERTNQEFRDKYRGIDVLLIDDIQFISEKEGTQEEFFHTFNALYNANKQIVISSDQPPKDLVTLEERLRSRFGCGLIVDITLPDFETRTAILEKKCEIDHIEIPQEVTHYIAKSVISNIRDLEGALNKVAAYAKLSNIEVTMELAEQAISDLVSGATDRALTLNLILEVVSHHYGITMEEIKGKRRTQRIAYPRQVAMYLARKMLPLSLPQIGSALGRDHSTISHGCDKITYDSENDPAIRQTLITLENQIKSSR